MSGSATDYLEQAVGDHIFRTASFAKPSQLYIGLFTTMPADDGTGAVEVSGNNYARVRLDPGNNNWYRDPATNRYWNSLPVEFPLQTAPWGDVIGFGIFDQTGNLLIYATLTTPRTVDLTVANPVFPPGYLVVTVQ